MHEMSLCEGILQIIEDQSRANSFNRVKRLRLEIGRLSGVEISALRFGFDVVMRGSPAEGAELEIIELPGKAYCFGCGETVEVDTRLSSCPKCKGNQLTPAGGDEMRIKDMEVV